MKIKKKHIVGGVVAGGIVYYFLFEKFINNLKLGLKVLSIENGNPVLAISALNAKKIPYSFKSIKLINDTDHLATATENNLEASILPVTNKPILFKSLKETSKNEIENSKIAITYSFLGFEFPILYTPIIEPTEVGKTEIDDFASASSKASSSSSSSSKNFNKYKSSSKCGCKH